ncbi:uncharacterized protein BP5553_04515 [Venustampulla echinocandica]|uniref:Tse2 ADP-ribosyltransferase toxin domain-containing protein n=1 Tax=Venustampulla echinocandica TaxID=2656787 RepID=A0A370TNI5_9HELO|nr:uncharacterized protein BP5553_04515 [Venustampulla echinocandica]RDL37082.1 hypothetical protein BP5553_04515 [Venustampulla echinocandica]
MFGRGLRRISPGLSACYKGPRTIAGSRQRFSIAPGKRSSLYDPIRQPEKDDDVYGDGLNVAKDGLIYCPPSEPVDYPNGACFMPNTFTMQEHIREFVDQVQDCNEAADGASGLRVPYIIRVRRGTTIPSGLKLQYQPQYFAPFHLGPAYPMSLDYLNQILDRFYTSHGEMVAATEWLASNEYHNAFVEGDAEKWMAE